jgi:hypothetical protein
MGVVTQTAELGANVPHERASHNTEVRIHQHPPGRCRCDRLGKCQRYRIPFVRACDVALSHVGLAFKLQPGVAVIFVGGAAGVGLQSVSLSGIAAPAGSSSHSFDFIHISARRLSGTTVERTAGWPSAIERTRVRRLGNQRFTAIAWPYDRIRTADYLSPIGKFSILKPAGIL